MDEFNTTEPDNEILPEPIPVEEVEINLEQEAPLIEVEQAKEPTSEPEITSIEGEIPIIEEKQVTPPPVIIPEAIIINPPKAKSSGLAIASLILGIISIVFSFFIFIAIPTAAIGLILGIISLALKQGGKGLAIAGVILAVLSIGVAIIFASIVGAALMGLSDSLSSFS